MMQLPEVQMGVLLGALDYLCPWQLSTAQLVEVRLELEATVKLLKDEFDRR